MSLTMNEIPPNLTPPLVGYSDWLARDFRAAFAGMQGFSPRNLKYICAFAEAWPDAEFVQRAAALLNIEQIERELTCDDISTEDDSQ